MAVFHLPPIPAGVVILAAALLLLALVAAHLVNRAIAAAVRRARGEVGKHLRQAFVAGFAAGAATGWTGRGRILPAAAQPRIPRAQRRPLVDQDRPC